MEIKNENTKKSYATFKEKNKEKVKETIICNVCGGRYTYFNKSHHNQSQKHLKISEIIKEYEEKYKNDVIENDISQYVGISID